MGNLKALFKGVHVIILRGSTLQHLIIVRKHASMDPVFYLLMREVFVDWSEKVDINRLANGPRFNAGLDAVDISPFWIIRSHLKHIDEVNVLCNLHYFKIMSLIISLILVLYFLSDWHYSLRLSRSITKLSRVW